MPTRRVTTPVNLKLTAPPTSGGSWWAGLSPAEFSKRRAVEQPRMENSPEGRKLKATYAANAFPTGARNTVETRPDGANLDLARPTEE